MYEPLCHLQPLFKKKNNLKLPISEKSISELINLPTHLKVSIKEAKKISKIIIEECKKLHND